MVGFVIFSDEQRDRQTPPDGATLRWLGAALVAAAILLVGPAPAHADWVRTGQWHLYSLNAASAWKLSTGAGVVVAVVDSGVDATHVDLAGQVLPGVDLVGHGDDGRVDAVGHGTSVAALIAGKADGDGVEGLAPNAKILPVRVLDDSNRYSDAAVVARGVRWAVDHGADIINLSLGGDTRSSALAEAISYAWKHDVIVVACTGNVDASKSGERIWYPAREPGVVAVTGLTAALLIRTPREYSGVR